MLHRAIVPVFLVLVLSTTSNAQQKKTAPALKTEASVGMDTSARKMDLAACLRYALKNQPALNQSLIDETIARANNLIGLSGWLPQVNGAANYTNYLQLPTTFSTFNGALTSFKSGVFNVSIPSLTASETIFSTDVLLAARAAKLNTLQAKQLTESARISLVANVTRAFYDLLLSVQQVGVYQEDTARLRKNQDDAYSRYVSGIVDKVDYKQARIALNNSLAQLRTATEAVQAKYAVLQQLMGFPADQRFTVLFDTVRMMQEVYVDTNAHLQFEKRIEYQILATARRVQHETTLYYRLSYLPNLSAFYSYNYEFESEHFSDLYRTAYPYSLFGLQLNLPIFTGFKRTENVRKARLQEERTDWDEVNIKLGIFAQYKTALANYKSNLYNLGAQRENVEMAREVYNIVQLQYREGVKAYLDVIVAESDLQTSEINYLNALFHLLGSKIDLEQAMGDIPTNI